MPGIARKGQDIAGGGVALGGSQNVNINGTGAVRIGDTVASHGLSPHSPTPPMVSGSITVKVNGIGVCRVGDVASCGHAITGSTNVFAGG
jgi:uncharacterized Zn-binding protein involved in type VI secretion